MLLTRDAKKIKNNSHIIPPTYARMSNYYSYHRSFPKHFSNPEKKWIFHLLTYISPILFDIGSFWCYKNQTIGRIESGLANTVIACEYVFQEKHFREAIHDVKSENTIKKEIKEKMEEK